MINNKEKIKAEISQHISPLIGWLRMDAVHGKKDFYGERLNEWYERLDLAAEAIATFPGEEMSEYEYNLRVDGKIFYTVWSTEEEMVALWKVENLNEVKKRLNTLRPGCVVVRRIRTEIEEV